MSREVTSGVDDQTASAESDIRMPVIEGTRAFGLAIWNVPRGTSRPWDPANGPRVPMIFQVRSFGLPVGRPYKAYEPRPLWWERALARTKRLFGLSA